MDLSDADLRAHLAPVADRVSREFAGTFSPETVERYLEESLSRWSDARITTHIPVLAERFVRQHLRNLRQGELKIVKDAPEVLFVCVHNAGRSQMAAALLRRHARGRVLVRSAGSLPAERIDPTVVKAMREVGLDLTEEVPRQLTDGAVRAADVVVTMGCGDACPVYPGRRYIDWDLHDPSGRCLEDVRRIRDEIDRRVLLLLGELAPSGRP